MSLSEQDPILWDRLTRLLHWLLVGTVALCLLTGWIAPPSAFLWHVISGLMAVSVVLVRLVWGLYGPETSRLSQLPLSIPALRQHGAELFHHQARFWPAHPPFGALMVVVVWGIVLTLGLSGVMALGGQEQMGPLAFAVGGALGHSAAELHEALAALLALAALGHMVGVAVEGRLLKVALWRSMIDGRRAEADEALFPSSTERLGGDEPRPLSALSLSLGILLALAVFWASGSLLPARVSPLRGDIRTSYDAECGACHMPYHPSLLPRASWEELMASLDNHFGEDASLSPTVRDRLTGWLVANAAESQDGKAALAFRRVSAEAPYQITRTPFWQHRHHALPVELFSSPKVRTAGNCRACHQDAEEALFRRINIHLPTPENAKENTNP